MKNVIIISRADDCSTDDVLDWCFYLRGETNICRINDIAEIEKYSLHIHDSVDVSVRFNANVCLDEDTIYIWYRRGHIRLKAGDNEMIPVNFPGFRDVLANNIQHVADALQQVAGERGINKYGDIYINKITALRSAVKCGLSVPETLITNDVADLKLFISQHKCVIVKDITKISMTISSEAGWNARLGSPTMIVTDDNEGLLSDITGRNVQFPLQYQKYIEKRYELRIFYLQGTFFSMAIFSQENERTKYDFRNYDDNRPNRCVPYSLPAEIEENLRQFMKIADLNCGSIDMIYTPNGDYVFLEVNPVGQYQWLEGNCNYPISKSIAEALVG